MAACEVPALRPLSGPDPHGATRWSPGSFDKELGGYIKYPTELERSRIAERFGTGPGIVGALPGTAPRGENEARAEGGLSGARAVRAALSCPRDSCYGPPGFGGEQRQRLHRLMAAMGGRLRRRPRAPSSCWTLESGGFAAVPATRRAT